MKGAVHTHMARPALSQWPGHCIEITRSVLAMSAAGRPGVPARPRARLLRRVVLTSFVLSSSRPRVVVGGRREAQRVDASSAQRAASARRAGARGAHACLWTEALLVEHLQQPTSGERPRPSGCPSWTRPCPSGCPSWTKLQAPPQVRLAALQQMALPVQQLLLPSEPGVLLLCRRCEVCPSHARAAPRLPQQRLATAEEFVV